MVHLRDIRRSDMDMIRRWRNLPEVSQYMFTDHYITPEEHRKWFTGIIGSDECHYWIIVADGTEVGLAGIVDMEQRHKRTNCEFYLAHASLRRKGIGSVAEFLVLGYVFDQLRYNKLCCEILVTNEPAVAMHKRFGFQQEGLFRDHVIKDGKPVDVVALAILRKEWLSRQLEVEVGLRNKELTWRDLRI